MIRRVLDPHIYLVSEINRLLPQLSSRGKATPINLEELWQALANRNFYLFVAEHLEGSGRLMGMAIIFFQWRASGWLGEIHDVVVDEPFRGQGLGDQLTEKLLQTASEFARVKKKKVTLYLTSKPSRIPANRMYKKYGFKLVGRAAGENGTNLYKKVVTP